MSHFRNSAEIPIILVGTQGKSTNAKKKLPKSSSLMNIFLFHSDAISERSPRVIDDSRARKLANDLKRCAYFESCSTYGYNVEKIFHEGKNTEKKSFNKMSSRFPQDIGYFLSLS